jgi:hypothetical protein
VQKPKGSHLNTDAQNRIFELFGDVKIPKTQEYKEQLIEAKAIAKRMEEGEEYDKDVLDDLSVSARRSIRTPDPDSVYKMASMLPYEDLLKVYRNYATDEEKVKLFLSLVRSRSKHMKKLRPSEVKDSHIEFKKISDEERELERKFRKVKSNG